MRNICYCTVVSFEILLLFVFIFIFAEPIVKGAPVLCTQTKPWKLNGRNIVADSKGFVLLVALMPMECEHCQKQFMKFQTIMETLPDTRVIVVAPCTENPRLIEQKREEFRHLLIGMESLDNLIWNQLEGSAHDHFIYDRCGRLANIIRNPESDMSKYEDTFYALKLAVNYAQCGWCQYDPPDLPSHHKPMVKVDPISAHKEKTKRPRIEAMVYPENHRTHTVNSDGSSHYQRFLTQFSTITPVFNGHARNSDNYISSVSNIISSSSGIIENNHGTMESQQEWNSKNRKESILQRTQLQCLTPGNCQRRVSTLPNSGITSTNDWGTSSGWTISRSFPSRIDQDEKQQHEEKEREQQRQQEENRRKQTLERLRIQMEHQKRLKELEEERIRIQKQQELQEMQRQRQYQEQQSLQQQKQGGFHIDNEHERRPNSKDTNNGKQFRALPDSAIIATKTSSLYDTVDEENDYDYIQAANEAEVIPREKIQSSNTKSSEPSPFLFEHQIPCAAFTDQVCIEQKKKIGADKMSKCCDKGVYLTDICVPDRCTNATTELCCMQKFLQAKYKCCLNDSKAINSPGNAFSHCCFHNFVQENDKCCPIDRAKFHWLTAYEICLPNVRVDLSGLRFTIHLPSNVNKELHDEIKVDLNKDKSWDHKCEQGTKVLQFPYLPNDLFANYQENDEENRWHLI